MLSRIKRTVVRNRVQIGSFLLFTSILWLMGVAGADDFNMHYVVMTPILPLFCKAAVGLIGVAFGTLLTGGVKDEEEY